jgi:hypothetical protein
MGINVALLWYRQIKRLIATLVAHVHNHLEQTAAHDALNKVVHPAPIDLEREIVAPARDVHSPV